jgi:hypothetical protein
VTVPYIHVLYPGLVHLSMILPLSPTSVLKMTLTGFNVPYSYMCRKHLVYTHLLYLPLPLLSSLLNDCLLT